MNAIAVVLAFFALVVVAVMAYRAGYLRGQAELLRQRQPTEAEWNALRMKSVLSRWRRVAGWAAYTCSGLLLCLFLALAFQYAKRWGWAVLMAAWVLWFALFMGGIWLAEWCWNIARRPRLSWSGTSTTAGCGPSVPPAAVDPRLRGCSGWPSATNVPGGAALIADLSFSPVAPQPTSYASDPAMRRTSGGTRPRRCGEPFEMGMIHQIGRDVELARLKFPAVELHVLTPSAGVSGS